MENVRQTVQKTRRLRRSGFADFTESLCQAGSLVDRGFSGRRLLYLRQTWAVYSKKRNKQWDKPAGNRRKGKEIQTVQKRRPNHSLGCLHCTVQ